MTYRHRKGRPRSAPPGTALRTATGAPIRTGLTFSLVLCAGLTACGPGNKNPDMPGTGDMAMNPNSDMAMNVGPVGTLTVTAAGTSSVTTFIRPLDTVPTGDGSTFYFTAMGPSGMGVFKVSGTGGNPTQVDTGAKFVSPFGIAITADNQTLIVADASAGYDPNNYAAGASTSVGQLFTLSASGGTPAALSGTAGFQPRSLDIVTQGGEDTIFFTGTNPTGAAGLFKTSIGGGTVTPVATGAPFTDPSGVAVNKSGVAFVVNTSGAEHNMASIIKVSGGTASVFASGLAVGYPAGAALRKSEDTLFVSGLHADKRYDVIYQINTTTAAVTSQSNGITGNTDSGGLHRGKQSDVYSWADLTAGGTGTVYRIEFK